MFKKFEEKEHLSGVNNVKSSVLKGIRKQLLEQYPHIADYLEEIVPKKEILKVAKCQDHIELFLDKHGHPTFFKQRDGPLYPSLRTLHKYPFLLPHMQVDKGAIPFVLSGANIMCPGLTSPGARMTKIEANKPVAVMAEGKEHAIAIGFTQKSSEKILEVNKGVGVDNVHYLNDGLWQMPVVK